MRRTRTSRYGRRGKDMFEFRFFGGLTADVRRLDCGPASAISEENGDAVEARTTQY